MEFVKTKPAVPPNSDKDLAPLRPRRSRSATRAGRTALALPPTAARHPGHSVRPLSPAPCVPAAAPLRRLARAASGPPPPKDTPGGRSCPFGKRAGRGWGRAGRLSGDEFAHGVLIDGSRPPASTTRGLAPSSVRSPTPPGSPLGRRCGTGPYSQSIPCRPQRPTELSKAAPANGPDAPEGPGSPGSRPVRRVPVATFVELLCLSRRLGRTARRIQSRAAPPHRPEPRVLVGLG